MYQHNSKLLSLLFFSAVSELGFDLFVCQALAAFCRRPASLLQDSCFPLVGLEQAWQTSSCRLPGHP